MRRLSPPLSADVCAASLTPLVTLEAAVTPRHSRRRMHASEIGAGPAALSGPQLQPHSGPSGPGLPRARTSYVALATGDESGGRAWGWRGSLSPDTTTAQVPGTPRHPQTSAAGQDGCADEGGAAPAVARPLEATHHLLVLLQQRAGQVQLGAGVDGRQREPGGRRAHELHHGGLQRREGVGDAGLVPHREGDDLAGRKMHRTPRLSPRSTGSPWTHGAVLQNGGGGDNPSRGLTTVQGYVDGRRRDLPAGALEAPTNRTELACSKRRVWGCHAASQDWPARLRVPPPARPTWCSLSHPPALILSLPACRMGTTATAVSQDYLED